MSQPQIASPGTLVADPGYTCLVEVFRAAHNHAARGKGFERHANGLPFEDQRMLSICRLQDSPDGMAYQVMKKITEGLALPEYHRTRSELLGALNYLAGIVIFLDEKHGVPGPAPTPDELAMADCLKSARSCSTCHDEGVVPMNGGRPFAPCPDCRP